jgi:UDP-N-acetylmuramyl pentapeptide phosphotransferase/UDP-N-acetylglucosamine-1-phosphate transferase
MVASYYFIGGAIPLREFMALTGGMVIAMVGLLDDLSHLDIRWRVPAQFAAAICSTDRYGGRDPGITMVVKRFGCGGIGLVAKSL